MKTNVVDIETRLWFYRNKSVIAELEKRLSLPARRVLLGNQANRERLIAGAKRLFASGYYSPDLKKWPDLSLAAIEFSVPRITSGLALDWSFLVFSLKPFLPTIELAESFLPKISGRASSETEQATLSRMADKFYENVSNQMFGLGLELDQGLEILQ